MKDSYSSAPEYLVNHQLPVTMRLVARSITGVCYLHCEHVISKAVVLCS